MTYRAHVQLTKHTIVNPEGTLFDTGYWSRGHLLESIEVGRPISMDRYARARQSPEEPEVVEWRGHFTSSPVVSIDAPAADGSTLVRTLNSVWKVETITS